MSHSLRQPSTSNRQPPVVTSVTVSGGGPNAPVVVSAEENALEIAVRDALLAEPRLGGADLSIRCQDDRLTISGTVQTDEQRILVLDLAARFVEGRLLVDDMHTEVSDQSPDFCEA